MMESLTIAILLFDRYTALDVVGPYEVWVRIPGVKVKMVAKEKRAYSDSYGLKLLSEYQLAEITEADILFLPGGQGVDEILTDHIIMDWIRAIDSKTRFTTSVCSGGILLAAAGLLDGKKCTTHWRRRKQLERYEVSVLNERVVQDGKIITSAGVSAGIDMALYVTGKLLGEPAAEQIQLGIEYDPQPPFPFSRERTQ